jgi:type IV pilus secretin PilQ/predicted competence protein
MMKRKTFQLVIAVLLLTINLSASDIDEKLNLQVSPKFVGASIQEVLRVLSRQYSLNLVVGDEIRGSVTVQLDNVTLSDALNAILKSHGYHYVVYDNVIYVKAFDQDINGELSTKVFQLKYLDGFNLKTTLETLLSSKGKIEPIVSEKVKEETDQRSDILVVTDMWENVKAIENVIQTIDVPSKQIHIEVRLVETLVSDQKQIGINLPKKVQVSMTGGETTAPITQQAQQSGGQQRFLSAWYELPNVDDNLHWGVLTIDELKASLDYLATDNNSRIVSNPKVTTLNNKKASIKIGTEIPIQEVSRGVGGDLVTFRYKDVNLNLDVIPRINENDLITLDVHPMLEEIVGYTGPTDFQQPITSKREVQTMVTVKDGETLVLGGLIKETNSKVVEKVWLLGDIPLLKYLFSSTTTKKEKTDLLIFITPKIM